MDSSATNANREQRSNSTTSTGSAGSPRRASVGAGLFSGLHEQKRSADPAQQARRQSLHDQRPAPGMFGKMWNNWVHGTPSSSK